MRIIVAIITLIIILLFASKKNYKELLTFLIISLIADWIFVSVFSSVPLLGTIANLIGRPILDVLTYATAEAICLGILYLALQKYNYAISLIAYLIISLIINLIINKPYIPNISTLGNIILYLIFDFIIGIIIIIAYKRSSKMEDINWFVIIGATINAISAFFIAHLKIAELFYIIGVNILTCIWFFIRGLGPLLMPYIMGIILSAVVIHLASKKLAQKDSKFRTLVNATITAICVCISIIVGNAILNYLSAVPDELYAQMKEINDNKSLIGKSKEEVVTTLGKPVNEESNKEDENIYKYKAGKITNYLFFSTKDSYILEVFFDENNNVISTSINIVRTQ